MLDSGNNSFANNPAKGSIHAYLDIFSDYENSLLAEMYSIEKEIDFKIANPPDSTALLFAHEREAQAGAVDPHAT